MRVFGIGLNDESNSLAICLGYIYCDKIRELVIARSFMKSSPVFLPEE